MKSARDGTPWWYLLMVVGLCLLAFRVHAALGNAANAPAPSFPIAGDHARILVVDDAFYAPFSFLDLNGNPAGIVIDIWNLWSKKTGVAVEFHLMNWKEALTAVEHGGADAVASLFKTEDREKIFSYSRPFFSVPTSIFFHKQIHGIKSIADLQGFPIGVVSGDSAEELVGKSYPQALLRSYANAEALIKGAVAGELKVFILDSETARFYLAKLDGQNVFKETTAPIAVNALHAAVRKGDEQTLALIQRGLDEITETEIRDVVASWVGSVPREKIAWPVVQFSALIAAAILALILLWNASLRRTVAKALADAQRRHRELQDSEARFKALFNLAPFSCVVTDLDGRFRMVNHAFCTRMGVTEAGVQGRTMEELGYFADGETTGGLIAELKAEGEIVNKEVVFRSEMGPRYVIVSSKTIEIRDKKLILSALLDITDRKRVEQELRESEHKFNRLFESAPVPMAFAFDTDGYRATTWNEAWYRTFGYNRGEAGGKSGADLGLWVVPEERQRFLDMTMRENHGAGLEAQLRKHDGSVRYCRIFGRFIGKADRQVLMAVYLDITDQKMAEQALRDSEERFSKAFRSSPAPMTISEIETGRFIDVNERWLQLVGYGREQLIGVSAVDLGIWHEPEARGRMIVQLRSDGSIKDHPIAVVTAAGEIRDVLFSGEIINLRGTEVLLSLVYDYSDRKRAEREREHLQQQLLQSQKMESVGRLAGGVAHDYNNMLGVILGHAELALMKSRETDPLRVHIKEIVNAANRSAELTQQLLAFARRQTIAPKAVDLNEAISVTLQMLRWLIGENIEVVFLPWKAPCPVKIDPGQLDQILINLCVNARDAISGVGRISIETQALSLDTSRTVPLPAGEYVLLMVGDTGSGMDKESQAKIFEPFYTTKEMGQGTGLGLATVYGIIQQNAGHIGVYSEPGKGTTFRIYLPRHDGETSNIKQKDAVEISGARGETILMVEDEDVLLRINATMLTDLGYTVLTANTPTEAVRLGGTHAGRIDLMITDVVMPEMNGRELQRIVQRENPEMACLFMSGYTADVISHHGVLDEGVLFLQKPFSVKELASKVREILDQHPRG